VRTFKGDIAEVMVFNRALSAGERQKVNGYLDAKYKIVTPKISIINPGQNSLFASPTNIAISAAVADDNNVVAVQFFAGPTLLQTLTNAPYNMIWTNAVSGTYPLTATATDTRGLSLTSSVVTIVVDVPPYVWLTSPTNGAVLRAGSSIGLKADAFDEDGYVTQIAFFQGTNLLGSVTNTDSTLIWSNLPAGNCTLTARATDNNGMITTSSAANVFVDPGPTVVLSYPTNNARFVSPTNIILSATVSDPNGTVTQVQFLQGSTVLGTVTNAPYNLTWTNAPTGVYAVTASAIDNYGLVSTSSVATFVVAGILVTNPANNIVLTSPATVTLNASAVDNVAITNVQYFQGTNSIGMVANAPYSLVWTNIGPGVYVVTAVARNINNQALTSPPISLISDTNPMTSDRDGDGASDYIEYLEGRNPLAPGAVPDTNGVVNLQTFTPLH
jgi:hypothetical protein